MSDMTPTMAPNVSDTTTRNSSAKETAEQEVQFKLCLSSEFQKHVCFGTESVATKAPNASLKNRKQTPFKASHRKFGNEMHKNSAEIFGTTRTNASHSVGAAETNDPPSNMGGASTPAQSIIFQTGTATEGVDASKRNEGLCSKFSLSNFCKAVDGAKEDGTKRDKSSSTPFKQDGGVPPNTSAKPFCSSAQASKQLAQAVTPVTVSSPEKSADDTSRKRPNAEFLFKCQATTNPKNSSPISGPSSVFEKTKETPQNGPAPFTKMATVQKEEKQPEEFAAYPTQEKSKETKAFLKAYTSQETASKNPPPIDTKLPAVAQGSATASPLTIPDEESRLPVSSPSEQGTNMFVRPNSSSSSAPVSVDPLVFSYKKLCVENIIEMFRAELQQDFIAYAQGAKTVRDNDIAVRTVEVELSTMSTTLQKHMEVLSALTNTINQIVECQMLLDGALTILENQVDQMFEAATQNGQAPTNADNDRQIVFDKAEEVDAKLDVLGQQYSQLRQNLKTMFITNIECDQVRHILLTMHANEEGIANMEVQDTLLLSQVNLLEEVFQNTRSSESLQ